VCVWGGEQHNSSMQAGHAHPSFSASHMSIRYEVSQAHQRLVPALLQTLWQPWHSREFSERHTGEQDTGQARLAHT
jgi:hypothetical protein